MVRVLSSSEMLKRKAILLRHEGIEVDGATASSKVHPEVLRLNL